MPIERMARVALTLSRVKGNPSALRVSVLKQTSGKSGVAVELEMNEPAAMVRNGPPLRSGVYEADEQRMLAGQEGASNAQADW